MTITQDTEDGGQIVEATAIEEPGADLVAHEPPGATLFNTDDPVEVVQRAAQVADALKAVIDQQRLFENIKGKSHVRVEGWQLLGSMLGITAVCTDTEEVDGGWKATVEARTLDGRVVGRADALCTRHEKGAMWKSADDYARLSMAQTRATSKALKGPLGFVVSLAGYSTTPREEMGEEDEAPTTAPPAKPEAKPDKAVTKDQARKAAKVIEDDGLADQVARKISHVTKRDAPRIESHRDLIDALEQLSGEQLSEVGKWVVEKRKAGEVSA